MELTEEAGETGPEADSEETGEGGTPMDDEEDGGGGRGAAMGSVCGGSFRGAVGVRVTVGVGAGRLSSPSRTFTIPPRPRLARLFGWSYTARRSNTD